MSDTYQDILERTQGDYETHVLGHPLFKRVAEGKMTTDNYVAYLRETYHLVGHTSRATALVPARIRENDPALADWFADVAKDEQNHDRMCVHDLKTLGLDPTPILKRGMGPGSWAMISQLYYMCTQANPLGVLGVAMTTEGLGADLATGYADLLEAQYGVPREATTFLRNHGVLDQHHVEEVRNGVNTHARTEDDIQLVEHARRMTIFYYGQLFTDVLTST